MRKFAYVFLVLICSARLGLAGDVQLPGKSEPPPPPPACTENCTNSATTSDDSASLVDAILDALLLGLTIAL
jgi:hypothetical protein